MKHTVIMHNLMRLLSYNPDSGLFKWNESRGRVRKDSYAGSAGSSGYTSITVDGRHYFAHRLAWLFFYGEPPSGEIDHIDGDRGNNKIVNLRDVTRKINQQNRREAQRNNRCGLLGVSERKFGKYKFVAYIKLNGLSKRIGAYATAEEAHAAYVAEKAALHPGSTL